MFFPVKYCPDLVDRKRSTAKCVLLLKLEYSNSDILKQKLG